VSLSLWLRDIVMVVGNLVMLSLEHGVAQPMAQRHCDDCGKCHLWT
jgi:hypothetical protein